MSVSKTAEEIYAEMKARFEHDSGCTLAEGGDMQVRLCAAAAQLHSLYIYNDWVRAQCFPQTASGEYLDYHAQMRGLSRNRAEKAAGTMRFIIDQQLPYDVPVAAGTICRTVTGLTFVTVEDRTIPAGELSCDVVCQAGEAGAEGNVPAAAVVYMVNAPVGVSSCTNIGTFTGGSDEESDDELRARVLSSYRSLPNGANAAYYREEALSISGVAAVKVLPKKRGLGTVDLVISADD
ncbi:MAG: baseplate J/gp47 family protein, partial [Oscillospiraceae bacterium]|nr:baseplate J/gp47 family protein [Oscillospiraceae bacterium]